MMRMPTGHKEKYSIKSEISKIDSHDGTAARTRPFTFVEIMLRRKNKKHSESVKDQSVACGGVEYVRYRDREIFDGREEHASKEQLKVNYRTAEKIVESEYKESQNTRRRSVIDKYNTKDSRKDRGVHEKRKNLDRLTADFEHEHLKRHSKDLGKSEHVRKRTQNAYDDFGKKHESRKWHNPVTSEKKQKKSTPDFRHEDVKSRTKRPRSRERERDKSKKSKSPSPRGQKQRYHDAREHEDKVVNNGSNNWNKRQDASPTRLGGYSPRKRRSEAGWDLPPVKMDSLPSLNKPEISNRHEVGPTMTPSTPKPTLGVLSSIPFPLNVSVDSVQLTQATRPKRRIYVENLPSSTSEAAVMQWLSGYLRPFGVSQVQGVSPCISCMVNKEKGQALVEFLTPEDASAALNFDGKLFSGNIVKIRRPKDYVEQSTGGVSDKPVAVGARSVKNVVQDSPYKIFIGGISKAIKSEMLMEIASAFGPLKSYRFEDNAHLHSPCAFLEYADQSVTVKACVGLNGLKLGGQMLTVTQATHDVLVVGNHDDQPFYGTPVLGRPLLEKPTQVLKLKNVLDPHSLPSLSEPDLEEILEDVRLECARFGMVKSINIIKQTNMTSETVKTTSMVEKEANSIADQVTEPAADEDNSHNESNRLGGDNDESMAAHVVKNLKPLDDDDVFDTENKSSEAESLKNISDHITDAFEAGCVLVEYKRTEASSMAAHCLHGRVFDGRIVSVEYVAYDVYCARFCK